MFNRKIWTISWKIHRPYEWMAIGGWTPTYTKEVTGNWYIDLTDAVVNKLLELKAYWWCEQASTPTPTTPVDIKCNNWVLKVKDKELPVWYVRIASIELDGNTYYDTNEKLYWSDTISMKLDQSWSGWRNIFGAYRASWPNYSFYWYNTATWQAYLRYGDTLYRPTIWTGIRTLKFWPWTTTGFATNVTITADTFESADTAYIGALPNSSSPKYEWKFIWNVEVTDTNGTRLKWIPCKRKSDGVIWYYEVVNWNFLEPSGSGTPTAWAEDYSNIEVYVDNERYTIGSSAVLDWYSVISNNWTIQTGTDRCLFGVKSDWVFKWTFKVKAGQSITVKAKINNLWSYLVLYNSETINSTNYIKRLEFSASTLVDWYYTRTVVCDTDWYAIFQWTQSYSIMWANDRKANIPCVEKVGYREWATATCEDLLWVWDYKDEQEILSGNVITKVGVMVLDGTEDWRSNQGNNIYTVAINGAFKPSARMAVISSHFVGTDLVNASMPNNSIKLSGTILSETYGTVFIRSTNYATASDFKTFLANQYAAWTPVIVVYPLATPTTLSVAWQHLSIPAWNSRIEIVEWSILDLPLYAKYKSTSE